VRPFILAAGRSKAAPFVVAGLPPFGENGLPQNLMPIAQKQVSDFSTGLGGKTFLALLDQGFVSK